jgi:predicted Zn-dependent protease
VALLITMATGDVSGTRAFGPQGAQALGALAYSRRHEEEADAEGLRMLLAAGIAPEGMVAFFEGMRDRGGERMRPLSRPGTAS